ncbi:Pyridoxal phosphate-dependent transferase major region subdomain 2 [Penicillium bovifimosum]|uniref:Pyridoxal phosphate-dependent transferase major region subdomain 2 n=1 Tax=Penicillium bovifimosum TaxID=126998 RepID=A0A9W9GWV7_9EURO|nr:Pyridoxal phosphate-dependent transferase major region subdomain 2 [Penicillium bovifimosum]KAJ5131534.1 Pyridoxal phosphate-dependent transferase major region subdomain 2 [Penicillium bovifimosum]
MATDNKTSAILHRDTRFVPKKVVGGKGSYLFLEDGTKFLDSTGGAAVSCLGHGNEQVNQMIKDQMDQVSYCHSAFFGTQVAEDLAQLLVDSTGGKLSKLFVVSSGSEAVEAALKLARQYFLELPTPQSQRTKFIARLPSYHGTTLGALGLGGHVQRREPFEPLLSRNTSHVSPCYAYRGKRDGESDADYVVRLAAELEAEFQRLGPETVCAFVAEPVVGAALGCVPAVPGYFRAMKDVCEKHGALFILDEIMSGMGRCGTLHAWEQEDVIPDIQTIGKGLGGGYAPVSGILIGDSIVQTMDKGTGVFRHGQTYQGHPVSCAAALAVQKTIQEQSLLDNVREMGAYLESQLKQRFENHPHVGDIRGKGLFWGLEFVKDKATKEPFDSEVRLSSLIQGKGLEPEYSVSLYGCSGTVDGIKGDHLVLAPPFVVSKTEIDLLVDTLEKVLKDVFASL